MPWRPRSRCHAPLLTIDALGRKCPIPIIMLAEQIRDVPVGEVIAVLADDPAAYTDVPAWCGMKSHEFVFRASLVGLGVRHPPPLLTARPLPGNGRSRAVRLRNRSVSRRVAAPTREFRPSCRSAR